MASENDPPWFSDVFLAEVAAVDQPLINALMSAGSHGEAFQEIFGALDPTPPRVRSPITSRGA